MSVVTFGYGVGGVAAAIPPDLGNYGPGLIVSYRDAAGVDHPAVIIKVQVTNHLVDLKVFHQDGSESTEVNVDFSATRSTNNRWSFSHVTGSPAHTQVNETVKTTGT